MYIEKISSPADVKRLGTDELTALCGELRAAFLQKVSAHGGHIGPNLGFVEATVALHYVFSSPVDRMVFDVSHQSYIHKMLTGRMEAFTSPAHYDDVSGYSEPGESDHDQFIIGHTSTSVSLACGLAKGRDLRGGKENVVAVIGDGSLSGGEALEGLDMAAELDTNLVIVVNDNQMSIAENHGGLYRNLALLRETRGAAACNLFRAMGLDYVYVHEGNDVAALIAAFARVKDAQHPVVVHVNTVKGKGYRFAEEQKERWHWGFPFDIATGETKPEFCPKGEDYGTHTAELLLKEMEADGSVVALTAGTPGIWGWTPERRARAGRQFVDVGIAEETAVAMASGIAKRGGKPVFGVHSSFVQRTYDQLSQDLCVNDNPATIVVLGGSLCGLNDVTHLGFFDIALMANIPNMVYLAPTSRTEYDAMLHWAIHQTGHPVTVRQPMLPIGLETDARPEEDYSALNRYQVTREGADVALLGLGNYYSLACDVAEALERDCGVRPTVVNPRYASGVDTELLDRLAQTHRVAVTLEDGALDGGWGEKVARHYGGTDVRVLCRGGRKGFVDRYSYDEYLSSNRLKTAQIVEDIKDLL